MRVRLAAMAALGLMAFTSPPAPKPAGETGETYVGPDWARRPSGEDMARHYPDRAQRLGLKGSATILCTADIDGRLRNCTVASETPPGMGFGEATLALSREFRMRPATRGGQPVAASIRIPVVYSLPAASRGTPMALSDLRGAIGVGTWLILLGLLLGAGVLFALLMLFRPKRDRPKDL